MMLLVLQEAEARAPEQVPVGNLTATKTKELLEEV